MLCITILISCSMSDFVFLLFKISLLHIITFSNVHNTHEYLIVRILKIIIIMIMLNNYKDTIMIVLLL